MTAALAPVLRTLALFLVVCLPPLHVVVHPLEARLGLHGLDAALEGLQLWALGYAVEAS